jgi:hypothetical protein
MKRFQYFSIIMTIFLAIGALAMVCPSPLAANRNQDVIEMGFEQTPAGSHLEWAGDVLVTYTPINTDAAKPSMDEAPNGDLYVAVESGDRIRVF